MTIFGPDRSILPFVAVSLDQLLCNLTGSEFASMMRVSADGPWNGHLMDVSYGLLLHGKTHTKSLNSGFYTKLYTNVISL